MSTTYPKQGLQDRVAFQQNGKPGAYPVQAWNDEIGTFQFLSSLADGYLVPAGALVVAPIDGDGVRLPVASDALAAGQTIAAIAAVGSLAFLGNPSADETVTVGDVTYKFVAELAAANDVLLGSTLSETAQHLVAAINGAEGVGTIYGAGTVANPKATAVQSENNMISLKAVTAGVAGNSVALTTNASVVTASGATFTGGVDAGSAAAANVKFAGVAAFSYWTTVQKDGYAKSELDVNIPVKQKGYVNVLMSNLTGAAFGVEVAADLAVPGKFKVAEEGDVVLGKINAVFPDYGTCEIEIKEFI